MIQAWRIVKKQYAADAFSGEGARLAGGRFNSPGIAVVYTASSLALAELEILVNLPTERLLERYIAFRVRFDTSLLHVLRDADLPPNWRTDPAPRAVKQIGDQWVQKAQSVVLSVPSAVVPAERNYVLNPAHADFDTIVIEGPLDPGIDPRLRQ